MDATSGVALELKTGVPTYQVEDEEGRIHLLIHLALEKQNEYRWCLWRPDHGIDWHPKKRSRIRVRALGIGKGTALVVPAACFAAKEFEQGLRQLEQKTAAADSTDTLFTKVSSESKSPDLDGEGLSREILACENEVYETLLGPQPDVEAWQKLTLPDYLYINFRGVIWTREENANSLKGGVVFSSIRIKESQVRKLSPTSALIVARVLIEAAAGEHDVSTDTLTSTVWVKQNGKWLAQLHTSIKVAQA